MLSTLTIQDLVLIDRLTLHFHAGLCTLTGETGAGKSILLDALGLTLGARAEARLVRQGAAQASVTASFDIAADHAVDALLAEHGIDRGSEGLFIRRTVAADGRSRAFINDQPVGVALLRRVGESLVEVHGQFDSQRLIDAAVQRDLVDAYGQLRPRRMAVASAWAAWQGAARACDAAERRLDAARRDEDFLRHAVEELETLAPEPGEEDELAHRRARMMNGEKLIQGMNEAAAPLSGDAGAPAVSDSLRASLRALERIADKAEGQLDGIIEALDRALTEATEGQALLERAVADLDLDPRALEEVEERLFTLRAVARKHGCRVDDLPALRADFAGRLAMVDDGAGEVARLALEVAACRGRFADAVADLSAGRKAAATQLDAAMAAELGPLKLGQARFLTRVEPLAETDWAEHGGDRVAFEVATNPGAAAGPLSRIASGGELARFMLALKVVLAKADPVPTLVFDEVDAGIGGAVAAAVGERLAVLARDVQVLVVTHSPQVAARGGYHWHVSKESDETVTRTCVQPLDDAGRREEIARMLAGANITAEARAAAESLLAGGVA